MRRPQSTQALFTTALLCFSLVVALARCAGCSEECSGQRQGAEGCPCQTDQDCTTVGAVLLCASGTCAPGDPPDAQGATTCEVDADCSSAEACAADATCQPAPACQRLDPALELTARTSVPPDGVVVSSATVAASDVADAPQSDCGMTITVAAPPTTLDGFLSRDGELSADGCNGHWFAAHRAGFVACGGQVMALSAAGVSTCLGTTCAANGCRALGDGEMGVCP